MSMIFRPRAFVTAAIIGLSAMTAVAAPPGPADPTAVAPPASPANTAAGQTAPDTQQSMQARAEQRIKDLHTKLQITAAQEADWQKFAQAMRDNARKMDQAFENRVTQMESMNAADNLQSYAHIAQQHAQDVQALLPPFKALYGKMSQSQKQTADQVFRDDANRGEAAKHG